MCLIAQLVFLTLKIIFKGLLINIIICSRMLAEIAWATPAKHYKAFCHQPLKSDQLYSRSLNALI